MSAQNVAIVRTLFAYWNARDARSYELLSDDVEMTGSRDMPGLGGMQRGHAAVRAFWHEWLSAWETVHVREFELHDGGDEVMGVWTQDMRGRGSEVVIALQQAAIFSVRDGRVARIRFYSDAAEARADFAA